MTGVQRNPPGTETARLPKTTSSAAPGDPSARERLAALAQPSAPDLVDLARQAAAESTGDGRTAWLLVATAIAAAETTTEARAALERAIDSGELRNLALACMSTLADTVS